MELNRASRLKGGGYLTSTVSVILLAVVLVSVAKSARVDGAAAAALAAYATSVGTFNAWEGAPPQLVLLGLLLGTAWSASARQRERI